MTTKPNLPPAAAGLPGRKMLLLLIAGVGLLIALALMGLGVFFWLRTDSAGVASTTPPLLTPTGTLAVDQLAARPQVVIVVSTATARPIATSAASQSNDSLPLAPTVTRAVVDPPTPPFLPQKTKPVAVDGTIELIAPDNNIQVDDTVAFEWRWLEDKGCTQPPEGYAFEIRVWRDNDAAGPRGAMDAKAQKQNISCDPGREIYSFTISRIKTVPGFEGSTEGRFRWDVALVQLEPYQPKISAPYRVFFTN
jgi:hypothetical protein